MLAGSVTGVKRKRDDSESGRPAKRAKQSTLSFAASKKAVATKVAKEESLDGVLVELAEGTARKTNDSRGDIEDHFQKAWSEMSLYTSKLAVKQAATASLSPCNVCEQQVKGSLCCALCSAHFTCVRGDGKVAPPIVLWLCPSCAPPPWTELSGTGATVDKLTEQFFEYGLAIAPHRLTSEQVATCSAIVFDTYKRNMETIKACDLMQELNDGFTTFKLRNPGRYDMVIPEFATEEFSFLDQDAQWMPLVRSILGDDCVKIHTGCMLSFPQSAKQNYHSDGDHRNINGKQHLPPHCLNVFVPLIDMTKALGPTEFIPTSHVMGNFDVDTDTVTPTPPAGSMLLFDYRLRHRGLGNNAGQPRPMIYLTYATPSFARNRRFADANFSSRRYHKLPEPLDPKRWLSREDRAARRQSRYEKGSDV